jgi:hypothetical protein
MLYYRKTFMSLRSLGATVLISFVALFDWGCGPSSSDSDHVSLKMSALLKERRSTNWEVSTAGLPQLTPEESSNRIESLQLAGTMEVYPVTPKPASQDPFNYVIWLDQSTNQQTTNQYWIVRRGGRPSSFVIFGPGKIEQK